MAVAPFPIQCMRGGKWVTIQTDELLPGDVVSVGEAVFFYHYYQLYQSYLSPTPDRNDRPCGHLTHQGYLHCQ